MEMDSQGRLWVGRGVYWTFFLMVGLAVAQAMQDLMHLLLSLGWKGLGCINLQPSVTISNNFWLEVSPSNLRWLSPNIYKWLINSKFRWLTLISFCDFVGEEKCDDNHHWGWSQIKTNYDQQQCLMEAEASMALKMIQMNTHNHT